MKIETTYLGTVERILCNTKAYLYAGKHKEQTVTLIFVPIGILSIAKSFIFAVPTLLLPNTCRPVKGSLYAMSNMLASFIVQI